MSDVALPAHIASLHSTEPLVAKILPANLHAAYRETAFSAVQDWTQKYPELEPPDLPDRDIQRAWDSIACTHKKEVLENSTDQVGRARILAASSNGSGAWLNAIPSTSFGTLMDRESLRINVALRVGAVVCQPHTCRCGAAVDSLGLHPLSCRFSAGRSARHAAVNDVVKRALIRCGVPSSLEPTGINRGDGKRPDGITLIP